MAIRMNAAEWQEERRINLAGGSRTLRPQAPTRVPAGDVALQDLPESVQSIVKAAGITTDSEFAWSWDEAELRKELEDGGVVLGEIDCAVRQLTSARTHSVEAMGAVCT